MQVPSTCCLRNTELQDDLKNFNMKIWRRSKGIIKSRTILVALILIMGGTSIFNIMFMLNTASEITDGDKEHEHDLQTQNQPPLSVPFASYWMKEKGSTSTIGEL